MKLFILLILFFPLRVSAFPEVTQVQQVALRYAQLEVKDIRKWKKNSRLSTLLPRLQFDYGRRSNRDIDLDINDNVYVGSAGIVVGPEDSSYSSNSFNDNRYGVRAIWSLDRLLFSQDQLRISVEARNLLKARRELLAEVNRYYFIYKNIKAQKQAVQAAEQIKLELAAAALDALTGGWFSHVAILANK